jgi:hypothetical protein
MPTPPAANSHSGTIVNVSQDMLALLLRFTDCYVSLFVSRPSLGCEAQND